MKHGKLVTNNVKLEPHEMKTIRFFLDLGKNIELIPPSGKLYSKHADCIMDKIIWELKCPKGKSKYVIRDNLRRALSQSKNIIIDLRRIKIHQTKCIHEIQKYAAAYKHLERLLVITPDRRLLDIKKPK